MVDTTQSMALTQGNKLPIGSVFANTFQIFGKAPLVFLLFGVVAQLPTILVLLINEPTSPKFTALSAVVLVVNLLILFLIQTAMTYIAVRLSDNQPAPLGEALQLGVRRYLPMLGTTILILLAIYGGIILLIVPGIIFSLMFSVAVPVCAVEALGPVASMKRSAALTKYTRWRILGIYVLFFVPLIVISVLITFVLMRNGHLVAGQWLNVAVQLFWVPIATIFAAAIYIALRRLKENVGVAHIFD